MLPTPLYVPIVSQCTCRLQVDSEPHMLNIKQQTITCFDNAESQEGDLGWTHPSTLHILFQALYGW